VSRFLEHASQIFEAAVSSPDSASADLTILIQQHGQIHILYSDSSPLDALQASRGCRSAFRVTRETGRTRVEGRQGDRRCVVEERTPQISASDALGLFRDQPLYSVAPALLLR